MSQHGRLPLSPTGTAELGDHGGDLGLGHAGAQAHGGRLAQVDLVTAAAGVFLTALIDGHRDGGMEKAVGEEAP